jgi:hypothetical protein
LNEDFEFRYEIQRFPLDKESILPSPRGGATLTQLENGEIYLIGGANREGKSFNDVYQLCLQTSKWLRIQPNVKSAILRPRSGHTAFSLGENLYVFGGMNAGAQEIYNDLYRFDTKNYIWTQIEYEQNDNIVVPAPRNAHAMIVLPSKDQVLLFGGSSPETGPFQDVFVLHVNEKEKVYKWEQIFVCTNNSKEEEKPEARELHMATFLTKDEILFSGGRNIHGQVCNDMALLNIKTWKWQLIPICEWNRCSHFATKIGKDKWTLSYGGWDGGQNILNDIWIYVHEAETWFQAMPKEKEPTDSDSDSDSKKKEYQAEERFGHTGCLLPVRLPVDDVDKSEEEGKTFKQQLLIFGGMNVHKDLNDLFVLTLSQYKIDKTS